MVEPAFVGTMLLGGLLLVAVFVAVAQSRATPLATGRGESAGSPGLGHVVDRWHGRLETRGARYVAFLVGGLAMVGAAGAVGWDFPVSGIGLGAMRAAVAFLVGGGLVVGVLSLATLEDSAASASVAFLLVLVGVGAAAVLAVAAPAPATNVWLLAGVLAVAAGLIYGFYAFGRSGGRGTAGAILATATGLFVLVLLGITLRLAIGS